MEGGETEYGTERKLIQIESEDVGPVSRNAKDATEV